MRDFSKADLNLLTELTNYFGPVGREEMLQEHLAKIFSKLGLTIDFDSIGNLYAFLKGSDCDIVLTAHADEIAR